VGLAGRGRGWSLGSNTVTDPPPNSTALERVLGSADAVKPVSRTGSRMIRAEAPVRQEAYRLQRSHRLRAFDAIHAATCLIFRIPNIVCYDRDFHHIDGLTIWEPR
jgi:predicted nucleic acid-binding protein